MSSTNSIPDYRLYEFSNGLRLIHKQVPGSKVVHCGYILNVGSRDEQPHIQGIAHFWEHMAFKGTQKRKAFHIINRLEILGGELNAYTTKEKMAFYASVLASHFDKAVDLLTDITFRSIFPEKEIEKEKRVILEEMAMYQDTPDDAIQDEFDALLFPGHPLGNNILGTEESVEAIRQSDFTDFFSQNISFDRLIFSSVGPFDLDTAVKIAAPHLESLEPRFCRVERQAPSGIILQKKEVVKPISQSHIMLGCRAYSLLHPNRLAFFLLNNVLGGPAMTSRLNFTIREKFGLVYGVESQYSPYLDTGSFSIYFATEPRNRARAEDLVWKEIRSLINKPLSANQLKNAKEQLKGQLAMAEEGNLSLMLMLGKSMMDMGKVQGLGEIFSEIDALRAEELQEIAIEAWQHDNWTQLSFIPEKNHSKK